MMSYVAGAVIGLVVQAPVPPVPSAVPSISSPRYISAPTIVAPGIKIAPNSLFPPSTINLAERVTSIDDILEQEAAKDAEKIRLLNERKNAYKAAQEAQEKEARAKYEAQQKQEEEKEAKKLALAEAKAAKAAESKAAKAAEAAAKAQLASSKAAGSTAKPSKYGTVERVSKQAERIEARKEAGEDAPGLFGL